MDFGQLVREARRRAGFSQRDLARLSGTAQPAIARIERGRVAPTATTLDHLLRACGEQLMVGPRYGEGVDRTGIRALLRLTPAERIALAGTEARNLDRFLGALDR